MKVKITSRTITAAGEHKAGSTIEVSDGVGKSLIAAKQAEPVESTKKSKTAEAAKG